MGVPGNTVMTGLKGCSIVDGGNKILLTGWEKIGSEAHPTIGLWDLATQQWTDLVDQFGITGVADLVNVRLHRNAFPGSGEPAIFFPKASGLAALKSTEDMAQLDFVQDVTLAGPIVVPAYTPPAGLGSTVEVPALFLNAEITKDTYAERLAEVAGACCDFRTGMTGRPGMTLTANTFWTATNNPFGNASEVTFAGDLVIASDARLIVNGLTLHFAPHAKLVVQRGARLAANNCTFTSACERWPGIRVEGNSSNPYQFDNPSLPIQLEQGQAVLDHCTVENARYGVWCAREIVEDVPDFAYYGGFVQGLYSTFRNCNTGVVISDYHRFDGNDPNVGPELPNRSYFASCDFELTDDWPGGDHVAMGLLQRVRHVRFINCSFANNAPNVFAPDAAGTGLMLFDALTYVDGTGNPTYSNFRNLTMGVYNAGGSFNPVRVQKMDFRNNVYGILDAGSSFVEFGRNTFHVADQAGYPNARVGMYLWQTKHFTIEENTFNGESQGRSVGIYFVGANVNEDGSPAGPWWYEDERIYNNTFNNLRAANLVSGIHRGNKATDVDAGLQLLCGDYTDNTYDIALLERSIVRPNQGQTTDQGSQNSLAGNRFFSTANCSSQYDWALDANWNDINAYTSMVINYKRHEFPDDVVGVSCDQWLNEDMENEFDDIPVTGSLDFIKSVHCTGGVYPIVQGSMSTHQLGYVNAKNLLTAAINTYEGQVDLGDTPDLETALKQNAPYLPSSTLRDLLLAKHPLSDDVLALMLKRALPMDPWHITQVLLQNSKLNPGIWKLAQEQQVLSPFLLSLVEQAQSGTGQTVKQVLEQEIVQRRLEMTSHLNVLGHIYARDTIGTPTDSLTKLLLFDADKENVIQRVHTLVGLERYGEAQTLLDGQLNTYSGKQVLQDLMDLQQSVGNDWSTLTGNGKDQLAQLALEGKAGSPQAAAILYSLGEEAPIPPVRFPNFTKPRRVGSGGRTSDLAAEQPALACYPNPSNMNTFLTYPPELDGTNMALVDAKGAVVYTIRLSGNGLVEVDTQNLAEGLYQVVAPGTGLSTKLTVQH